MKMTLATAILALTLAGCPGGAAAPATPLRPAGPDTIASLTTDTRAVLEQADQLEALAIVCERPPNPGEEVFHGYPVTKRVAVPVAERSAFVDALYGSIEGARGAARCFQPHHLTRLASAAMKSSSPRRSVRLARS